MKSKSNNKLENFFTRNDTIYLIGAAMLVVAFFGVWLGQAYSYILFIIGIACVPVGLVMFIIGSIGNIGQEDIDKLANDKLWEFDREILENPHYAKRMCHHPEPVYIANYDLEADDLRTKRGKDGKWRTSQYTAMRMLFLNDALVFVKKTVSVLSDYTDVQTGEYKYSELSEAKIVRESVTLHDIKRTGTVIYAKLILTAADGKQVLCVTVHDDVDSDALAESINKHIKNGYAN